MQYLMTPTVRLVKRRRIGTTIAATLLLTAVVSAFYISAGYVLAETVKNILTLKLHAAQPQLTLLPR